MQASELQLFWQQSDWVAKSVLGALLIMSILTWSILLYKLWQFHQWRRSAIASEALLSQGVADSSWPAALARLSPSGYQHLVATGLQARHRHRNTHVSEPLNDWLARQLNDSLSETSARLQAGLTIVSSVASTAPFIGLLGTVWGIYHAMMAISLSGKASIDQVSGPVGEALIMTAIGLFVAIPAVLIYNGLNRVSRTTSQRLVRFTNRLYAHLLQEPESANTAPAGKIQAIR